MSAWYYYRGKFIPIKDEHYDVAEHISKGYARIRYHAEKSILAVQGRSQRIVREAVTGYLSEWPTPTRLNLEWPGRFIDCTTHEWID